eukprot:jgi/Ulvmu1/7942/UM004_0175.1
MLIADAQYKRTTPLHIATSAQPGACRKKTATTHSPLYTRPFFTMSDTPSNGEADQQPQVDTEAETHVGAPSESADAADSGPSEATGADTSAPAQPDVSLADDAPDIREDQDTSANLASDGRDEVPSSGDPTSVDDSSPSPDTAAPADAGVAEADSSTAPMDAQADDVGMAAVSSRNGDEGPQSQEREPTYLPTNPPPAASPLEQASPSTPPSGTLDNPESAPSEPTPASPGPAETIAAVPATVHASKAAPATAASAALPGTARPVKGTLAKPNRGFNGTFVTRGGRKITPEELVQSVERLSQADLFGVDMKELLAMYANAPKSKPAVGKACISLEEMESMVDRLYTTKTNTGSYKSRPKPMKAIYYIENGAHLSRLEPIPPKPAQERTAFMCSLYDRCKESKVKSQNLLAEKYLQPLCKPKVYSGPEGKTKIAEIAQKLFAGEATR